MTEPLSPPSTEPREAQPGEAQPGEASAPENASESPSVPEAASDAAPAPAAASDAAPAPAAASDAAPAPAAASDAAPAPAPPTAPLAAPWPAPAPAPAPALDLELESARRPKSFQTFGEYFWASFLGASFGISLLGVFVFLYETRIYRPRDIEFALATTAVFILAVVFALWQGFPAPPRSIGRRIGRAIGTALFGGLLFVPLFALSLFADEVFRLSDKQMAVMMFAAGSGLTFLVWRARRARKRANQRDDAAEILRANLSPRDRGAAPYLWSGLTAAGSLAWMLGFALAVDREGLFSVRSSYGPPLVITAFIIALALAARTFPKRLRLAFPLLRRVFISLFFGVLAGLTLTLALAIISSVTDMRPRGTIALLLLSSTAMVAAGMWYGRELRSEGRAARVEAWVLGVVLVFGSVWTQSAWLRYALGSGEGARTLAEEHYRREEYERAATFYGVACERDDIEACAVAAHMSQTGLGGTASGRRARELIELACDEAEVCAGLADEYSLRASRDLLLSRACELGDKRACDRSRRDLFGARCSSGDAYACTELADLMSASEGTSSKVRGLWDKACDLGNPVACKRLGK